MELNDKDFETVECLIDNIEQDLSKIISIREPTGNLPYWLVIYSDGTWKSITGHSVAVKRKRRVIEQHEIDTSMIEWAKKNETETKQFRPTTDNDYWDNSDSGGISHWGGAGPDCSSKLEGVQL